MYDLVIRRNASRHHGPLPLPQSNFFHAVVQYISLCQQESWCRAALPVRPWLYCGAASKGVGHERCCTEVKCHTHCETAVFFNGVPTFHFSSSMNKLEVLSAAKARHLLLVLVYRERSAIYTLYKPWSSINSAWFHKTSAWLQKETASQSLWHWFKKWKYFWNMLDCYNIHSFFFVSEAFREPQSISGNAGWCVWTASICHQRV